MFNLLTNDPIIREKVLKMLKPSHSFPKSPIIKLFEWPRKKLALQRK